MQKRFLRIAVLCVAGGLGAVQVPLSPILVYSGISEYRLSNGLRVLLRPDASAGSVTVKLTYLTGSLADREGETGEAHLLEHLMFKGSKKHPNLYAEFTRHGVALTHGSGSTTTDRTSFVEHLSKVLKGSSGLCGWRPTEW